MGDWTTERREWTRFTDMHSGGGRKLMHEYVYIEGDEEGATSLFMRRFGRDPDHVTCGCCGPDYYVDTSASFAEASAYDRGECKMTPQEFVERAERAESHVLVIRTTEVRHG